MAVGINGRGSPGFRNGYSWKRGGTVSSTLNGVSEVVASADDTEYTYGAYLTYVYLDDGMIEISDCDASVTEIEIPSEIDGVAVTSIGEYAFEYCSSLTSVTIPDSVTSISGHAFYYCTSLTSIVVDENNESYSSVDGVLFNKDQTTLVCYPAGKTDTDYTIPDSVTSIGDNAFSWCTSLTNITIPDSVTSIGSVAFCDCTSLESITIPDSVTSIETSTFGECHSLIEITVLNPTCKLSSECFYNYVRGDGGEACIWYEMSGTMYGYDNSTAQAYAERSATFYSSGYTFVSLGEAPDTSASETTATTTEVTATTTVAVASPIATINTESTTTTSNEAPSTDLTGDINLDGTISIADVVLLSKGAADLVDLNDTQKSTGDTNADGTISSADVSILLKFTVQIIQTLPYTG